MLGLLNMFVHVGRGLIRANGFKFVPRTTWAALSIGVEV